MPENIVVPTDPGVSTAVVSYAAPGATDNVAVTSGPTLTEGLASGTTFPLGTTNVTYAASDAAGNTGSASFTVTVVDTEAPMITLSTPAGETQGPFIVTATFNEDVVGFEIDDVVVGNGVASGFVADSASVYRFTVTPTAEGIATIDVAAAAAQDAATNDSLAADQLSVTYDISAPTVSLSGPTGPVSGPFTVTATLNEVVTGFELGDIVVAGGVASARVWAPVR
ncbi:HYR domain-containing protein [Sinorhodobacter sp. B57]|nr:HYR domain-containing protein [Sedimentimonas flavescens]